MKIYVAGKFQEKERVNKIQDYLVNIGHLITHDWTKDDSSLQPQFMVFSAMRDLEGVREADVLIALVDKDLPYKGLYGEIGIAIALNKPVYLLGGDLREFVFSYHPLVHIGAPDWAGDLTSFFS
jgi:nucleoside 2-deoxyribosyltransferase